MNFCKLSAIIQVGRVDLVEKKLTELGVTGYTKMSVSGVGEYSNTFVAGGVCTHVRFEIYIQESRAHAVMEGIMEAAHTGSEGDGIVVLSPVNEIYRIRTQRKCHAEETC